MNQSFTYSLSNITPYINWLYFFYAWQMPTKYASLAAIHSCQSCRAQWLGHFDSAERPAAREAEKLYDDALQMLDLFSVQFHTYARFGLFEANAVGDDILVTSPQGDVCLPMLRQQHVSGPEKPHLCLADFIKPRDLGATDHLGIFATSVDAEIENSFPDDPYRHLLAQTLADRLAEATAEVLHADVRRHLWGFAPDENLSPQEMFQVKYQGIRPAIGYPSIPDQSMNFLLNDLINFDAIGITVTESGAMKPHGSVSGLIFAHPAATYFSVGHIDNEQLLDYAQRRHLPLALIQKFLTANL